MNRESFISAELETGRYIVWIYTPWISFVRESVFSVNGPSNTDVIKMNESEKPVDFVSKAFLSHASKNQITWELVN